MEIIIFFLMLFTLVGAMAFFSNYDNGLDKQLTQIQKQKEITFGKEKTAAFDEITAAANRFYKKNGHYTSSKLLLAETYPQIGNIEPGWEFYLYSSDSNQRLKISLKRPDKVEASNGSAFIMPAMIIPTRSTKIIRSPVFTRELERGSAVD